MEFSQSLSKSVALIVSNMAIGAAFFLYGLSFFLSEDVHDDLTISHKLEFDEEVLGDIIDNNLENIEISNNLQSEQANNLTLQNSMFSDYTEDSFECETSETPVTTDSETEISIPQIKPFKQESFSHPSNGK